MKTNPVTGMHQGCWAPFVWIMELGQKLHLKKRYTFKETNKQQQQQQGKKTLFPTAIRFAGVRD